MAAILALGVGVPVALAPPAAGHVCSSPVQVAVDRRSTLTIGVPAEADNVVRVDVGLPQEFELARVVGAEFWTGRRVGNTVRFEGGPLAAYSCGYFSLQGTLTERGKFRFPLTVHLENGGIERYAGEKINDPKGAQLVFAGVEPQDSDYLGAEEDDEASGLGVMGAIIVGLGAAGILGALLVRRYGMAR